MSVLHMMKKDPADRWFKVQALGGALATSSRDRVFFDARGYDMLTDPQRQAVALVKAIRDWRFGMNSSFLLKKWVCLDGAFLALALYWVLYARPFFVPTIAYNWRGHELAFALGTIATMAYAAVRRNGQVWEGQSRQSSVPCTA